MNRIKQETLDQITWTIERAYPECQQDRKIAQSFANLFIFAVRHVIPEPLTTASLTNERDNLIFNIQIAKDDIYIKNVAIQGVGYAYTSIRGNELPLTSSV
jgi:hypothetical protein